MEEVSGYGIDGKETVRIYIQQHHHHMCSCDYTIKVEKEAFDIYIWGLFVSDPSCSLLMYVTVILLLVKCLRPVILPSMM